MTRSEISGLGRLPSSPVFARVFPFAIFLLLTSLQNQWGEAARYWIYMGKTLAGAALIWAFKPAIQELNWRWSWEGITAGILVFALWIGLDGHYPNMQAIQRDFLDPILSRLGWSNSGDSGTREAATSLWNPHVQFGKDSFLAWLFVLTRLCGSAAVVPVLEEVFYRSFAYRYVARSDFLSLPLGALRWPSFLGVSVVFGFVHNDWLAGILCGLIYQGLVVWKGRLGDALVAHATTNFLLGLWVIWRGAWHLW